MLDIFVISPYTHPDKNVVNERAHEADLYIGELIKQGHIAYSTISAMHHLLNICDLPSDWEYWKKHCEHVMMSAYEVHVLCLDGWEESEGVQAEIEIASMFNKRLIYITKTGRDKC